MMSYIISPSRFWVHLVAEESSLAIDQIMSELNEFYNKENQSKLKNFFEDWSPRIHDVCCAKFSGDDR